jgi:hypothetical protein
MIRRRENQFLGWPQAHAPALARDRVPRPCAAEDAARELPISDDAKSILG